jgi:L-threonylcarbamoyladenylate synthase
MKQATNEQIKEGTTVLKQGGIVIFPTDTAFGIGCRMDNEKTVERLFRLRKRPETQATSVLISDLKMAEKYLQPVSNDVITKLIEPFWPGGLTIVLPCIADKVSSLVRGGSETLGVRVPDHLTTLEIINGVGVPILGPSANFAGGETPYRFEDLDLELVSLVDYVVRGECHAMQASTVIDCSIAPWKILRKGTVQITI